MYHEAGTQAKTIPFTALQLPGVPVPVIENRILFLDFATIYVQMY